MWNAYFSTPSEINFYSVVLALSPYLISNIKYRDRNLVTHLIALLRYSLFASQLFLLFMDCILLYLHLVSCGLCSWICLSIFLYRSGYKYWMLLMFHFPLFFCFSYLHLLCVMHHIVLFSKGSEILFFPCFPCYLFKLIDI